jgi:hypothetical protein
VADPADGSYDDWFELFNASSNAVDLSGYYLTDNLSNPTQFKIPSGWVIPAGSFLLVWADNTPGQNLAGSTNLHVNFALNRNGEAIGLFAPDGSPVHTIQFGYQPPNQSYGAHPDGSGSGYALPNPTPGGPNDEPFLGNDRPIIEPVGVQRLILGQTLSLQFNAADPDWPPQSVVFTLGAGAPTGMVITPSGLLTWKPATSQPATNIALVLATDSGSPQMTGTNALMVIVGDPPRLAPGTVSGGTVTLDFSTLPGKTYQVEYSDSLKNPVWTPLGDPRLADGASLTIQDNGANGAQRFYRIYVQE